jgi:hypothetical protein
MFDTRKTHSERALDAVDLIIDFATLGEYGLEPCESPGQSCEARSRGAHQRRSTGSWAAVVDHFATAT